MGRDKAQIQSGGLSLLERIAGEARKAGLPALIVGREQPADWPIPHTTFIADDWPGSGPLGGLLTALRQADRSVLLAACDMPALSADALLWLADQALETPSPHGMAVINRGQWEPLFSLYTVACHDLAEQQMQAGRLSLHGLIEAGRFQSIEAPGWVSAQLVNINTPEEWMRWRENEE